MSSSINVGLIICSTRPGRKCPEIASWVSSTFSSQNLKNATLTTIDLADFPMPISPSVIPAGLSKPLADNAYNDAEVDAWSLEVRKYDAFIFLTPQYNWSFTAAIKVAIDHLYFEWNGKSAMVVAYGSRGGGKAAAQLTQVLQGLQMKTREAGIELPLKVGGDVSEFSKIWDQDGRAQALVEQFKDLVAVRTIPADAK